MVRKFCLAGLVSLLLAAPVTISSTDMKVLSPEDDIFMRGVEDLYLDQFESALAAFTELTEKYPDHPAGPFCLAFIYDIYMDEYRTLAYNQEFDAAVNETIKRSEALEKTGKITASIYLFWGGAYGIRGVREAMVGGWWGAFRDGLRGIKRLKKVFDVDSTFYDGYYGTGNYYYWKSRKSRVFWWLPFIGDNREKGIQEIRIAMAKGKFSFWPAKYALMRIFTEEERWDDVLPLAEEVLTHNPNDLHGHWFSGYAYIGKGMWHEAIDEYRVILDRLQHREPHGIEGEVECWYYLGKSYYELGNVEEAAQWFDRILSNDKEINSKLFFYEDYVKSADVYKGRIDNQ